MSGLILQDVSKSFAGKRVVDRISLTLDRPGVYGLLGTNGAGKTGCPHAEERNWTFIYCFAQNLALSVSTT